MAVRIQLSSNFQVLELTYSTFNDIIEEELNDAIKLVNKLGLEVSADIKKPSSKKGEKASNRSSSKKGEKASDRQISYAISLGLDEDEAYDMTKEEIWAYIQRNKT
jgi:hypothetical protein